ncbi:MAG: prepilin-type N-terminal cleavage/methylation domain-containing protein [Gammaproteobacteria bacterium]|nr:prepilin-type N-terminal cleavage/methylation domain-containing protein [Gammaproteobacteria bacterium]
MLRSRGFSLLELLIAAALGVVLIAAVVQLFAGSSRGNAALAGQALLQESARHAVALLSRSARNAGYLGCGGWDGLVNGLNGSWRRIVEFDVSRPVEGFDGQGTNWSPEIGSLPTIGGSALAFAGNRIDPDELRAGSDVVVFRRLEAPGRPLARSLSTLLDPVTGRGDDPVVTLDDGFAFEADDFVVISNCRQSALFRIGTIDTIGRVATLSRPSAGGPFGNRAGRSLSRDDRAFGGGTGPEGAGVGRVVTEIYFVARGAGLNNRDETVWSLWRKTGADRPAELVQGVADLQVLFGVDLTPGDGVDAPNRYLPPGRLGADPVRTVHFVATVSSVDAVTADDRVLRRSFAWTVALRNG